jgi:hypothetical protein
MMYVAKSQSQATAAAATFIKQIDSWIMKLRGQNLRQNLLFPEIQIQESIRTHDETPTSQLNVQRRRRPGEIRMRTSHGEYTSMVHAALKELCILKHNIMLYHITMSEYYTMKNFQFQN